MIIYCTNGYSRLSKDGGLHGDGTFEEEMEDHHFSNKEDAIGKAKEMQFGTGRNLKTKALRLGAEMVSYGKEIELN